jgi:unsaturated pyranuronate lyase
MQLVALEDVKKDQLNDKIWRRIITGEKAMLSQLHFVKGAYVPLHHHESEQISYVVQGKMKFEIAGKEIILSSGEVLVIPSNVPHSALALEDTLDFDIFSPIRHDWLNGTDVYLRTGISQEPAAE